MFTGLIVATVSQLRVGTQLKSGKTVEADSNGRAPYIFNVVAGRFPNRNIKAGTIVENSGFEDGKTYLIQVRETEADSTYGRQFQFTKTSELGGIDIIKAVQELGEAVLFNVDEESTPKQASKAAPMVKAEKV